MNITFRSLQTSDFPLLLKWLESPHVKTWWDTEITWTPELVKKKYESYVHGYKLEGDQRKPIHAYIVLVNDLPVGYIQTYNPHDFTRATSLSGLPKSLAAFDMFIGEFDYLGQGIGARALSIFLKTYVDPIYEYVFADPSINNIAAITTYQKAGFENYKEQPQLGELWMIRKRTQ